MTIGKIIGLAGRKTVSITNRLMQNIDTDKDEGRMLVRKLH